MPNLIKSYDKELAAVYSDNYEPVHTYSFVHRPTMYAFTLELSKPTKGYPLRNFSGAVLVWHYPYSKDQEEWLIEHLDSLPKNLGQEQLFEEFSQIVDLATAEKQLVGNICFKEYLHIPDNSAVQIGSAWIEPDFQRYRIAPTAYRLIAKHENIVVSDNLQTPLAQKLWSSSLPQVGKVSIFSEQQQEFIEEIDQNNAVKSTVWGIQSGSPDFLSIKQIALQNNMTGYKVDQDCHKILLTFRIT